MSCVRIVGNIGNERRFSGEQDVSERQEVSEGPVVSEDVEKCQGRCQ